MPEVIEQAAVLTTANAPQPITDHRSLITAAGSSLFLPIIDNGAGSIRANFLLSVLNAFKGRDLHIERFSDSLVTRARNRAASYFLRQTDRDYIMFIDTDILFTKDHIDWLMESDEPVLAGIYCIKQKGVAPCINTLPGHVDTPAGGYLEIARAGTGFMRIHRSVLEKMKEESVIPSFDLADVVREARAFQDTHSEEEYCRWLAEKSPRREAPPPHATFYTNHGQEEWDFFRVGVVNKEYLSEDWWFCDRARALGFKVMLDTRIQLRHEGVAVYPLEETIQKHVDENGGKVAVDQAAA